MKLVFKILLAGFIFATACFVSNKASAQLFVFENPLIGQKAPDFTLKNTKGESINLTKFRNNQPAIIFFWATWCPHCREQLKELNASMDKINQKGIKIIPVDVGESAGKVTKHLEKQKINMVVFLDQSQDVSSQYGLVGVPTFFFLDKEGKVKAVEHVLPAKFEELVK